MKRDRIALYIRLSKGDDRDGESNSVTMQRMLLRKYTQEHFPDCEVQEFCDDGYTGTNFERPGVQRLLAEVRDGKIDCIIVKDFSRFARDYIELGSYLERIFPFLGVRFISVNDHYDSRDFRGSIAGPDMYFKNLLYDLYSKDLSQKVRSSLAVRKERGQYLSANAPFGYEKDPNDRHSLVIAEDEAEVVRKIFSLTVEGYTSTQIARLFNENHVKTPAEFRIAKGQTVRKPKGERFLWSSGAICRILKNEVYIGNVVQKKYEKDFVGGKNHRKPCEEWLVTCHHHEAVIDWEMFDLVQEGRGKKRLPQHRNTHPLTGMVVCGCCRRNLQYRSCLNPYFTCHTRYSTGFRNCVDKVNAMYLEQYVLYRMQERMEAVGERGIDGERKMDRERKTDEKVKMGGETKTDRERKIDGKVKNGWERKTDREMGTDWKMEINREMKKDWGLEIGGKMEDGGEAKTGRERETDGKTEKLHGYGVAELKKELIEQYIENIVVQDERHIEILWKK